MKTALYSALLLLALALTGAVLVVTYDVHQDLAAAREALKQGTATISKLDGTVATVNTAVGTLNGSLEELKPTITDIRRTILIAGGTLNLARDTLRNEQASIRAANEQTIATMQNVNAFVQGLDSSQKKLALDVAGTLETIQPVMAQTQKDLSTLDLVIGDTRPLLANTTATMGNAARISGDLAKIVDDSTKPQPWYKKAWGYIWAPIKIGAVFLK